MRDKAGAASSDSQAILVDAVNELTKTVEALRAVIERDYPKRKEVEEKYATKYGIKKQRVRLLGAIAISILAAYFLAIETVSYCFLGDNPYQNRAFCQVFPGYSQSQERNRDLLKLFNEIVDTTQTNDRRITELEKLVP
jgi:hypothetical protein